MPVPNPKWNIAGPQVICKEDFQFLEDGIMAQGSAGMQPPLVWVDNTTVRVQATPDCPAAMQFTGIPNILNPSAQVSGGLSDGLARSITIAPGVSMNLASGGLYGTTQTEKVSQWYAVFALADDADTDFTLRAIPIMRVKSQGGQVLSLGNLSTPGTGIGYGFTTDELKDGLVYFLSGDSKGLMRAITANNNNDATGGTITYGGAAVTVAAGDWFIVLPPGTNFRLVGTIFNNSAGHIVKFRRLGHVVQWLASSISLKVVSGVNEDIRLCCPLATAASIQLEGDDIQAYINGYVGHEEIVDSYTSFVNAFAVGGVYYMRATPTFNLEWCRYKLGYTMNSAFAVDYRYPPGCGY